MISMTAYKCCFVFDILSDLGKGHYLGQAYTPIKQCKALDIDLCMQESMQVCLETKKLHPI